MKKKYSAPNAEIILFDLKECIQTGGPGGDASIIDVPDKVDLGGEF